MPVPSIRPPGWRLEGTDELENRPNGPKDYNPHDYRDWKQQIAEYEAEGISRPGAILECVVRGAAGAAHVAQGRGQGHHRGEPVPQGDAAAAEGRKEVPED